MHRRMAFWLMALLVIGNSSPYSPARADEINWVGYQFGPPGGLPVNPFPTGSFFHGDNWLNYLVPGPEDTAIFDATVDPQGNGMPFIVHFGDFQVPEHLYLFPTAPFIPGGVATVGDILVKNGTWTFDMGPAGVPNGASGGIDTHSPFAFSGSELRVGDQSSAFLTLRGNGLVRRTGIFVEPETGMSRLVVGNDTTLTSRYWLDVSRGELIVVEGGKITSGASHLAERPGSTATVVVAGSGSEWTNHQWLEVGYAGAGELRIESGGTVTIGGLARLGFGSVGKATVTGSGSEWIVVESLGLGSAALFGDGSGELIITDGGKVSNSDSYLGWGSASKGTATVAGPGSQWNNDGTLIVGNYGIGEVSVEDGGSVTNSGTTSIGLRSSSTGIATVTGPGAEWKNDGSLTVGSSGTGTLNIARGGEVTINERLYVGFIGTGELNVSGGGKVTNAAGHVGAVAGSTGSAKVSGTDSEWTNDGDLMIGDFGTGTLSIESGGKVTNNVGRLGVRTDATGTSVVSGPGSEWTNSGGLYIGTNNGTGSLLVEAGGTVATSQGGFSTSTTIGAGGTVTVTGIGSELNSSGALDVLGELRIEDGGKLSSLAGHMNGQDESGANVTVTGAGSEWINEHLLYVGTGDDGWANLHIAAGARVTAGSVSINSGSDETSTARVVGDGSEWNSGPLAVGDWGTGVLEVKFGAKVRNTARGDVGYGANGTGTVTVAGAGSEWNNEDNLYVASFGTAELTVAAGGTITAVNSFLGRFVGSSGTATVTGLESQWNNSGSLYVGGTDSTAGGQGLLNVENAGVVEVGGVVHIWPTGTLAGKQGSVRGDVMNLGTLAAGPFPGALTIDGDFTLATDGILQVDIGSGTVATGNAVLDVEGAISLDGLLQVSLFEGYTPTSGDSFNLLGFSTLSGEFATLDLQALADGLSWNISQLYTAGELSVVLPGDFNGDNQVDAADYTLWKQQFGSVGDFAADGNGDGVVDAADYTLWRNNLGAGILGDDAAALAASTVPEPHAVALLLAALALGCTRRLRSRLSARNAMYSGGVQ